MKSWENLEADVDLILGLHFSAGREGRSIEFVGIHYDAGNPTVEDVYSWWQSREASAHYQVEEGGRIGQLVWDSDTAWSLGNWDANCRSLNIEHANRADGTVSEACLDNGAHLTAAICKYYGLGRPEWLVNVFPHRYFSATSCPGELYGSQKWAYIERAQAWYDAMCAGAADAIGGSGGEAGSAADAGAEGGQGGGSEVGASGDGYDGDALDDLACRTIAGEFGNGDARRAALGDAYESVQARVNEMLGCGSGGALGSSAGGADIEALAQAVIRGDYGNGEARKAALGDLYNAVQARVNGILLG